MIRAPFNFVPLADKVVFPEWSKLISQDVPFSDGISGDFCVKVKALTPIFVRNGYIRDTDKNSDEFKSFCKTPDGTFFIPSTSIKGELRHLLEILSFSKMQRIDNKRYSIRDVNNREYRDSMPYESVHCGWMSLKANGEIEIADHGIPYRISHKDIDEKLGSDFCTLFGEGAKLKDTNRTAEYKYRKCHSDVHTTVYKFSGYKIYPNSAAVDKRMGARFDSNGSIRGRVVFTGQPGNRRERRNGIPASGKFFEFVFKETDSPKVYKFDTESELFKDFVFIYKDSSDWKYWKQKAQEQNLSIPVFFKVENCQIHSFGLSYLYKLPYNKRIKDFLGDQHSRIDFDLAECIFGETMTEQSLKGRVQFSNALCEEEYPFEKANGISPYMGGPKPSYYPIYLEQQGANGFLDDIAKFSTMMDKNAKLRGWKLYPARLKYQTEFDVDENQIENTNPSMPLGAGSVFVFHVRFHNLRPIELGALLYATLLQKQSCHSLGFAKPLGYGVCKYDIVSTKGFDESQISEYIKTFVDYMEGQIPNYSKSPQIKELFLMLNPYQTDRLKSGRKLEYMELKEFVDYKKHNPKKNEPGEFLPPYSELLQPIEQQTRKQLQCIAEVTFFSGSIKKAKLKDNKDVTSKLLDMNGKKDKLKTGDIIEVEIVKNGKELRYLRKK